MILVWVEHPQRPADQEGTDHCMNEMRSAA